MSKDRIYKKHINGLKGFACLMVMIGHFIGIYKYAETFPKRIEVLDIFLDSKLEFILDETFWVILFFVVSGYLVAMSQINNFKQLLKKCIQRFMRLGIPIFFVYLVIWIIQETMGFYTSETSNILVNTWIQKTYLECYTFVDIILAPVKVLIFNQVGLNGPYWVLRDILLSSVLIYILNYVRKRFENKTYIIYLCCACGIGVSFMVSRIMCACLVGMFLLWLEEDHGKIVKEEWFAYVIIIGTMSLYVIPRAYISFLFFATLIIFIPRVKIANNLFTSKTALFFGEISFGIYSFHWPVFCSVGMYIVCEMSKTKGIVSACVMAVVVSSIVTIIMAILFHFTFERFSAKIVKKCIG